MFTLYTRYTVTMPQGMISESGIRSIEAFLHSQNLKGEDWQAANANITTQWLPALPNDWQWVWVVPRGEYAGTMPKRIAKYYYKVHGLRMPQNVVAKLGQIAESHSSTQASYTFDFANKIDWKAGDFGENSGSCWWGSYTGARVMWDNNGGLSIRFYNEAGEGFARAWVMEIDTQVFTVMNGYGLSTLQITRIFAHFTGLSYKQISLENSISSTLYINGGGGFVVGSVEAISEIEYWDFSIEGEDAYTCNRCGRIMEDGDQYTGADSEEYCESCFYDIFDICEHCSETYWSEDMHYIESAGYTVCQWCYDHHFSDCDHCGETFRNRDIVEVGERSYCEDCLDDLNIEGENIE